MKKLLICLFALLFTTPVFAAGGWLPSGYTELEYIESTGTQYINTGVVPTLDYSFEIKAVKQVGRALIGSGEDTYTLTGGSQNFLYTSGNKTLLPSTIDNSLVHVWAVKGNKLYCDNISVDIVNKGTQQLTLTWTLFGRHVTGNVGNDIGSHKIYYAKLYNQSGTLVRNFIPARNASGVVGMYDTVNDQFYTNAGTGTFTAGPTLDGCRNLLPIPNDLTTRTINGVTFTPQPDGTVIVNGTPTSGEYAQYSYYNGFPLDLPAGTYTISGMTGGSVSTYGLDLYGGTAAGINNLFDQRVYGNSYTVTISQPMTRLHYGIRIMSGYTANNLVVRPMIERGSTATNYVPYTSACHPTSCGTNMFTGTVEQGGFSGTEGTALATWKWLRTAGPIIVSPNTTYAVDVATNPSKALSIYAYCYTSAGSFKSYVDATSGTFTTVADCARINLTFGYSDNSDITPSNVVGVYLVQGSTPVSYTACTGCIGGGVSTYTSAVGSGVQNGTPTPTSPIYPTFYQQGKLTLRAVGDTKDSYDASTGKITRRVGVKVLTGNENWAYEAPYGRVVTSLDNVRLDEVRTQEALSSHFVFLHNNENINSVQVGQAYLGGSNGELYIHPSQTSVSAFKSWLAQQYSAGTPVTVYYLLATPVQEDWAASQQYCNTNDIRVATTKNVTAAFSGLNSQLTAAIATVNSVVTNTIDQANRIAALATGKQTRPNETCPEYRQCLLVEGTDGTPHWYEINDPFYNFFAPILATNTNGTSSTNDPGYQQVEYLQGDGNAYINTGVVLPTNFELDLDFAQSQSASTQFLCGARTTSAFSNGGFSIFINVGKIGVDFVDRENRDVLNYGDNWNTTKAVVNGSNITFTVNGSEYTYSAGASVSTTSPLYIFDTDTGGQNTSYKSTARIRRVAIKNNGTLVRDMVPVIQNSTGYAGLYDKVNGVFYGNAASSGDDFTPGPIVANDAGVPGMTWSVSWTAASPVAAGTVLGEGKCNNVSGTASVAATSSQLSNAAWNQSGTGCWCKGTGLTSGGDTNTTDNGAWVFNSSRGSAAECAAGCAAYCAYYVRLDAAFRSVVFNVGG